MAESKRLTELSIKRAKAPRSGRLELNDSVQRGLCLRITANDVRTWVYRYRFAGRTKRLTIGRYPGISLQEARDAARRAYNAVCDGTDPSQEKKRAQREAERLAAHTFGAVAERFMREYERGPAHFDGKPEAKPLHRTWRETEQILNRYVLPSWRNVPIADITRADVLAILSPIKVSAPYQANKTLAIVRKLYGWALANDLVDASPCAGVKKPHKPEVRNRPLRDDEIRAFWNACEGLGYPYAHAYRLLLVTAQRRNEVCRMTRIELDFDAAEWELPAERTKAGRRHIVPLTELALEILDDVPVFRGPYVFSTNGGDVAINGFGKSTNKLREIAKAQAATTDLPALKDFRLHDLRETAATVMRERLGVSLDVVGQVLNHAPQTVTEKHYASAHSLEAKRRALDAWDRYLRRVIGREVENVVELRAAASKLA